MLLNCGLEKALESPWTARRSNQSILKEISPEYSLEGLMLNLKLQYSGYLIQRIDAFKPWCWSRLLSPLDSKEIQPVHPKGNQSWMSIGRLKLKLQYFGYSMWRTDSLEKTLISERLKVGEGDNRGLDGLMAPLTQWTWVWVNSGSWWWTGKPGMLQSMGSRRVRHD